jgi:hypothetical protein
MMNRRGVALLLALVVIVLAGAVLVAAFSWTRLELRAGRGWSDLAGAEAASQASLATAMTDRSAWVGLGSGQSRWLTSLPIGSAESTRVTASRLGDSLALLSAEGWHGGAWSAAMLLVRLRPDSLPDSVSSSPLLSAVPVRDRAWISLLPQ